MRTSMALTAMLLVGCVDTPRQISAQNGRVWEHRCPPAGTVVQTSVGGTIGYTGQAAPGLCRRADGQTAIYSMWLVQPGQTRPDIQEWLGGLFPATTGRASRRGFIDQMVRSNTTYLYTNDARVMGFETLNLRAGQIDAILIE